MQEQLKIWYYGSIFAVTPMQAHAYHNSINVNSATTMAHMTLDTVMETKFGIINSYRSCYLSREEDWSSKVLARYCHKYFSI